jgi:hypothetical protein
MSEVIHDAQQEFWRPPAHVEGAGGVAASVAAPAMAETCSHCGTEFLVGSRFCHACGGRRAQLAIPGTGQGVHAVSSGVLSDGMTWLRGAAQDFSFLRVSPPTWLRYLHFHEIKRWVGLPTASLVAFMLGLGCIAGAVCVSFIYKAQTFADWQAIQFWRIEWLLGSTACFVVAILLKRSTDS